MTRTSASENPFGRIGENQRHLTWMARRRDLRCRRSGIEQTGESQLKMNTKLPLAAFVLICSTPPTRLRGAARSRASRDASDSSRGIRQCSEAR